MCKEESGFFYDETLSPGYYQTSAAMDIHRRPEHGLEKIGPGQLKQKGVFCFTGPQTVIAHELGKNWGYVTFQVPANIPFRAISEVVVNSEVVVPPGQFLIQREGRAYYFRPFCPEGKKSLRSLPK
jgi:hypothetical protein